MMDDRKMKAIAMLIQHLMDMDGGELEAGMAPPEATPEVAAVSVEGEMPMDGMPPKEEGPMEVLAKEGTDPASLEDDMDEDELEELAALNA